MTKTDQTRLSLAAEGARAPERRPERGPDVPPFRHLAAGVLQVEEAVRRARRGRPVRPTAAAASVAPGHPAEVVSKILYLRQTTTSAPARSPTI